MRKKNRIKRKKTKDKNIFCQFVRAIFSYLLFIYLCIYFSNTEETLFLSLFLKPVIIKHVEQPLRSQHEFVSCKNVSSYIHTVSSYIHTEETAYFKCIEINKAPLNILQVSFEYLFALPSVLVFKIWSP